VNKLYFVGNQIGNYGDIGQRAKLMIENAAMVVYENDKEFNEQIKSWNILPKGKLVQHIQDEELFEEIAQTLTDDGDVALIADYGYPIIADMGHPLGRYILDKGLEVSIIAGPSISSTANVIALLPNWVQNFLFQEFMQFENPYIEQKLETMKDLNYNLVMIDRPKRIHATIDLMAKVFGEDRNAALLTDLTKNGGLPEVFRGTLAEVVKKMKYIDPVMKYIDVAIVVEGIPDPLRALSEQSSTV
tara:strand:- start:5650 stop:6384 length:735 start_codon:yes stop_codon:yes gene_type:complete